MMEHVIKNVNKVNAFFKGDKKRIYMAAVVLFGVILLTVIFSVVVNLNSYETTYKETEVYFGDLTVGITESSTVDIGTVEQVFEIDLSSLESDSSDSSSTDSTEGDDARNSMGGGDMFSQIFSISTDAVSTTSSQNEVTIESVLVVVGEEIAIGDPVLTLTESSVDDIRVQLAEDVAVAEIDLEEIEADQVVSRLSAEQTYESNVAYGEFSETEYDLQVADLYDVVEDAQDNYNLIVAELALLESENATLEEEYTNAKSALVAAEYSIQASDKYNNTYWYVQYENTRDEAESTVESLESHLEKNEEEIEMAENNLSRYADELSLACRELESGLITATETYDLRVLAYDNADETREITLAYLDNSLETVEETYTEMAEKLAEIDDYIVDQAILAEYSGVITEVSVASGDDITYESVMITLYDTSEVTMSQTVSEDDMSAIELGTAANIVLTAYEDLVYKAVVTDISEASYNSSTGENEYSVTVTIQSEVDGLYQGMTGDVTFITKESEEVLYVSNRAIERSGSSSYVKVKEEDGDIIEKEVETGFSDGINVEILEGLSEGDIVLIESKVSE